ncbi:MAG: Na/Pi cotransporter family protein [Peptostreptococcaceae bacterium]
MEIVVKLMGGVGLFLYGMHLMGDGLQKSAGYRLKKIIELLTNNPFMGVIVGALFTLIIQSSSATSVMVVGFVNAGIMNLSQAIGVIMGANIGTTITAQLISLDLAGLAPFAIAIGMMLYLSNTNTKYRNIGEILLGFGILFTGMDFMKQAVEPLTNSEVFMIALATIGQNPIIGVLLGFLITAIVQSSSASTGMLLAMSSVNAISLSVALPILYGENIGTCVTALVSSIGASKDARRAATMHLIFNMVGTLIFMLVLSKPTMEIVTHLNPNDISRQIANSHTLFNLLNVIILFPFSNLIVKLSMKIIPDNNNDQESGETLSHLDERMMESPSIALFNTFNETLRMGDKAKFALENSMEALIERSEEKIRISLKEEKEVNELQKSILNYLLKLSKLSLSDDSRESVDELFNIVNDIERISDHAENIAEIAKYAIDRNIQLSNEGIEDLLQMYNTVVATYTYSLKSLETMDKGLAYKVIKLEQQVNMMEKAFRENHMNRLNEGLCTIDNGVAYLEIVSNLERISDHAVNISENVIKRGNIKIV